METVAYSLAVVPPGVTALFTTLLSGVSLAATYWMSGSGRSGGSSSGYGSGYNSGYSSAYSGGYTGGSGNSGGSGYSGSSGYNTGYNVDSSGYSTGSSHSSYSGNDYSAGSHSGYNTGSGYSRDGAPSYGRVDHNQPLSPPAPRRAGQRGQDGQHLIVVGPNYNPNANYEEIYHADGEENSVYRRRGPVGTREHDETEAVRPKRVGAKRVFKPLGFRRFDNGKWSPITREEQEPATQDGEKAGPSHASSE